jgi:hypothetical protein
MQGTGVPPISDIVPNKVSLPPTPAQRPSHWHAGGGLEHLAAGARTIYIYLQKDTHKKTLLKK